MLELAQRWAQEFDANFVPRRAYRHLVQSANQNFGVMHKHWVPEAVRRSPWPCYSKSSQNYRAHPPDPRPSSKSLNPYCADSNRTL